LAIEELATAMDNGSLQELLELNIEGNGAGEDGTTALAEAFENGCCPKLEQLNLSSNMASTGGAYALSDAFEAGGFPKLRGLSLYWNGISVDGLRAIAQALLLGSCPRLQLLDLRGNATQGLNFTGLKRELKQSGCKDLVKLLGNQQDEIQEHDEVDDDERGDGWSMLSRAVHAFSIFFRGFAAADVNEHRET
jgi:Ran GTPase-activating protein (RanGAP) involved in mRNA processing and transport